MAKGNFQIKKKEKKKKGIATPSRNKILGIFEVSLPSKINIFYFQRICLDFW